MSIFCPASCVVALVLMHTQRRDPRLIARTPLVGAGLMCAILAGYAAWRLLVWTVPVNDGDGRFVRGVLAMCSGFALPLLVPWIGAILRQDLPRLARMLRTRNAALSMLTGLLFAGLYFAFGGQFEMRGALQCIDALFDADPLYQRSLYGVAIHTHTHPLLPLLWYVATRAVGVLTGPQWTALTVNSLIGGVCVSLAAAYFQTVMRSTLHGLLAAAILGSTAAHVVFGSMPESYIVSAATLVLLHLVVVRQGGPSLRQRHIVLVGVLAASVTITNVIPAVVCFAFCIGGRRRWTTVAQWTAYSLLIGAFLLSVQAVVRPEAKPFEPGAYQYERRFIDKDVSVERRAVNVALGVTVQNVVGSIPVNGPDVGLPGVRAGFGYEGMGWIAVGVWAVAGLGAVWLLLRGGRWRCRAFAAAAMCLIPVVALHSVYAHEGLFLYSCQFTFFLLAMLAHGLTGVRSRVVTAGLAVLLIVLVINNVQFCVRVLATLDEVLA